MSELVTIPLFPLPLLPLPNELIPLHIFEPRYRQLLEDVEEKDIEFGIYFAHGANTDQLGGLVRLESVLKRYEGGESDVVVKCVDVFIVEQHFNQLHNKLYPGGRVLRLEALKNARVSKKMSNIFKHFVALQNKELVVENLHDMANALDLEVGDRLKYLKLLTQQKRENFLLSRVDYRKFILQQEMKYKRNYYLN